MFVHERRRVAALQGAKVHNSTTLPRIDLPALVRAAAMAACAVGVGVWGALLLAPTPSQLPPALDVSAAAPRDTAAVAQWFGGAALRVRVVASGIIAGEDGFGAALLSIDGGPPRAYRVGQTLAPGVTLHAVAPTSVAIAQEGTIENVAVPVSPHARVRGFVPVPVVSSRQP